MSNADPYTDPETGVLYNKLGLRTWTELRAAERDITRIRAAELAVHPPPPTYDLEHLRAVHRRLFSDLYEWAGEVRTVDIAKGQTLFCRPQFLVAKANELLSELAADQHLGDRGRSEFIEGLAHYLGELNALHGV